MEPRKKAYLFNYKDAMPTGAGSLFLIQIFATIGFSVLYSTLILYATQGLKLSDMYATSITGSFVALNYFLHLLGGYIGGRWMSFRGLFAVGMLLQVIGCVLISVPSSSFLLWGLAVFLGGSGLNVTCINCMVTQLFEPNDKNRETAFLWNYSGMNLGFFIGFTLGGYFHLNQAYHELFILSSIGNSIALIITFYRWKLLKDRDTSFVNLPKSVQNKKICLGLIIVIALVFFLRALLAHTKFCNNLIMVVGAVMLFILIALSIREPGETAKNKLRAYIFLALSSLIFWTLYQLTPMGLNLFIERNIDRHFLGFLIATQWVQNINTIVIIIGGPLLGVVFSRLRARGLNISIPFQFSLALLLIGIALAILPIGILFADENGYVNFNWILASYILMSSGELFISPIGYAMVGQLAPVRLRGLLMGTWMMITGVAAILSDYFSKIALGTTESTNPIITNPSYSHTFGLLGWSAIIVGICMFICIPLLSRLTQEKKTLFRSEEMSLEATGCNF